jgi:hypothetical protein
MQLPVVSVQPAVGGSPASLDDLAEKGVFLRVMTVSVSAQFQRLK